MRSELDRRRGWARSCDLRPRPSWFARCRKDHIPGGNLLIVDLFPATARDPHGIHRAIWARTARGISRSPEDKPLTCVSYVGQPALEVFLEPVAVGDGLPDMPLFLSTEIYVPVPLEATYDSTWGAVPDVWREVILSGAQDEPEYEQGEDGPAMRA